MYEDAIPAPAPAPGPVLKALRAGVAALTAELEGAAAGHPVTLSGLLPAAVPIAEAAIRALEPLIKDPTWKAILTVAGAVLGKLEPAAPQVQAPAGP